MARRKGIEMPEQLNRTLAVSTCSVRSPEPGDYDKMADLAEQLGYPSTVQQVRIRLDAMANSSQYAVYVANLPWRPIGIWLGPYGFLSLEQGICPWISGLSIYTP